MRLIDKGSQVDKKLKMVELSAKHQWPIVVWNEEDAESLKHLAAATNKKNPQTRHVQRFGA